MLASILATKAGVSGRLFDMARPIRLRVYCSNLVATYLIRRPGTAPRHREKMVSRAGQMLLP